MSTRLILNLGKGSGPVLDHTYSPDIRSLGLRITLMNIMGQRRRGSHEQLEVEPGGFVIDRSLLGKCGHLPLYSPLHKSMNTMISFFGLRNSSSLSFKNRVIELRYLSLREERERARFRWGFANRGNSMEKHDGTEGRYGVGGRLCISCSSTSCVPFIH